MSHMPRDNSGVDSAWVKERAHELGFSLVGITSTNPPNHFDIYSDWIHAKHHAGMTYLARPDAMAKRADPLAILPECQSIVVTGTFYSPNVPDSSADYQVAAYAQGRTTMWYW